MPVRIEDSDEEVAVKKIEEDSDEEIISVKRSKFNRLKSDDSEEEDDKSHSTLSFSEKKNTKDNVSTNDETSGDDAHNVNNIPGQSQEVLKSQDDEHKVLDGYTTVSLHSSPTVHCTASVDERIDFKQIFANKDLYDPEDSDDDSHPNSNSAPYPEKSSDHYDAEGSSDESSRQERIIEKKLKSIKARKSSKKNESKNEVDEIHRETQRLVRQSRVSLPYHKPRQRTLAEFLQRRPSVPVKSLRMSKDELKLLAKQVEKRAKEVEEFYKSSSDDEKSLHTGTTHENSINENSPVVTGSNKSNDKALENTATEKCVENADVKDNKPEVPVEENVKSTNCSLVSAVFSLNGGTEHTKNSLTDAMTKSDSNELGIDFQDVHLKIEDSETCNAISENYELQVQTVESHSYLMEDTQSAMDPEKNSITNEKCNSAISNIKMPFSDEIDSQDICLRIEDTETFGEVTSERNDATIREQCFSKVIKEITNSEENKTLSIMSRENTSDNSIKNVSLQVEEMDSQHMCLKINDTEPFGNVDDQKVKCTSIFLEGTPVILTTKEYERSSFKNKLVTSEFIDVNKEVDSQDICLRIENSETLDANYNEKIQKEEVEIRSTKVEKDMLVSKDDENVTAQCNTSGALSNTTNVLMNASEQRKSQNLCLYSLGTDMHDLLENNNKNGNSKTMLNKHIKGTNISSSRRNLSGVFSETESQSEDKYDNSLHVINNKEDGIAENVDNLKLILEGEETRVAFEQDDSLLLGRKASHNIDKPEKMRNSNNTAAMFISESESSMNLHTMGTTDEIECREKNEDMSKEPNELELYMKDSVSNSKENVIRIIQRLRGNDDNDPKNANLLRTMSLLEGRLQSSRKSLKLQNSVPQLKGSPNKVIDLDDTPSSCDINVLKQRFLRHSFSKTPAQQKSSVEVSVISAEKGSSGELEVKKEVVAVETETENLIGTRAKLRKLKEELQRQIVKEREEEWNRRQLEMKEANSLPVDDEKSECGLFDEDEEEMDSDDNAKSQNEEEEDSEDEEEEEDDYMSEKKTKHEIKRRSCTFVDDEAEVSDEDASGESTDSDEDDTSTYDQGNKSELNKTSVIDVMDQANEYEAPFTSLKRTKTLDPFESQEVSSDIPCEIEPSSVSLKTVNEIASLSPSVSDADDAELDSSLSIPPYQPGGAVSQIVDPVGEEPYLNIIPPTIPTLPKGDTDPGSILSQFPQSSASFGLGIPVSLNEVDIDEVELLGLCSGKFTSQPADVSQDETMCSNSELDPERKSCGEPKATAESILQSSIAQNFMKDKFSEETKSKLSQEEVIKEYGQSQAHKTGRKKFVVVSSDEEEEPDKAHQKSHKLTFSDDEDDNENSCKVSTFHDQDEPFEVEYDSEENEVPVKVSSAKEFFENEAELSESEWGSADEDEKGLDDFEVEEGDDEKMDQRKVKEQLDKIHMRRILDDDQQEVRRLQELLLEDGEFHSESGGRQRQFRWKNLNNTDDLQLARRSDNEASGGEDEEDESQWRRKRFERETFLLEHKNSLEKDEELLHDAVKLKFKAPVPATKKNVQVKRGSFLARSEAALARIAQLTKNTGEVAVLAPSNSRNFVFATLSQDPKSNSNKCLKRKAPKTETPIAKKFCVSTSLLDQIG